MKPVSKIETVVENPRRSFTKASELARYKFLKLVCRDYRQYYLKATKSSVWENPEAAVGPAGLFDEMAEWQIDFLKSKGLEESDQVLDVGCGVLRGGIPLIQYLDTGNYAGMDISREALHVGGQRLEEEELDWKNPVLIHNSDLYFEEEGFSSREFDFIWVQSVFTHLPRNHIEQFFQNVGKVLAKDGCIYATYYRSDNGFRRGGKSDTDFYYPRRYFKDLGSRHGFSVEPVECSHPNDLDMIRIARGGSADS